jgi:hypothetical protein
MPDSKKIDDGGPAFPQAPNRVVVNADGTLRPFGYDGLSLRDWFAGQALAGMIERETIAERLVLDTDLTKHCAFWAYHFADAMLAARTKP